LRLGKRKSGPTQATPAAVKGELEKLAYLPPLDAHMLDLSVLPVERRRFLAGVGAWSAAQALQCRDPERRDLRRGARPRND